MLKKGKPRKFTRRRFIETTGLVAGASLLSPTLAAQAKGISEVESKFSRPLVLKSAKIGVFLPRTKTDALEAKNFLAGLQLQLKAGSNARQVELITQTVRSGFGSLESKFEQLSQETKPNLVIGFSNPAQSYLQSAGLKTDRTAFLGVSLGENIPRVDESAAGYSQNVAHLSFMSVEANWLLGQWAAQNVGKKAVLATSFYDSGFDTLYAFQAGFEAGGGQVVGRLITHTALGNSNLNRLSEIVTQTQPDLVFGSYYGQAGREFLTAYKKAELAGKLPLFGSPFLVAGTNLDYAFPGIKTNLAWSSSLENSSNQQFVPAYFKQTGQQPDAFAVLGYEAALLATDFLNNGTFNFNQVSSLSPRAGLELNAWGQLSSKTFYLHEVQQLGELPRNSPLQQLGLTASAYKDMTSLQTQSKSGWLNSYAF